MNTVTWRVSPHHMHAHIYTTPAATSRWINCAHRFSLFETNSYSIREWRMLYMNFLLPIRYNYQKWSKQRHFVKQANNKCRPCLLFEHLKMERFIENRKYHRDFVLCARCVCSFRKWIDAVKRFSFFVQKNMHKTHNESKEICRASELK